MQKSSHTKRAEVLFIAPLWIAIAFYLTAVLFYVHTFGFYPSNDHSRWGEFGDFIGGVVNPALGLITILLLLTTIAVQRKELELTRDEMAKSSEALALQAEQFERKNLKDDLYARADRVYQEIDEILNQRISSHGSSDLFFTQIVSTYRRNVNALPDSYIRPMKAGLNRLGSLLAELDDYLLRIDELARDDRSNTDYYRRRVAFASQETLYAGHIDEDLKVRLTPNKSFEQTTP